MIGNEESWKGGGFLRRFRFDKVSIITLIWVQFTLSIQMISDRQMDHRTVITCMECNQSNLLSWVSVIDEVEYVDYLEVYGDSFVLVMMIIMGI